MADNVAITAGSGTSIATDDIGGVQHQRVKISLGADGAANDALGGAGAVADGVQRVTLASDDPVVTRIGEVQASPTSNTVLDRLKALLTGIVLSTSTNTIGKVDHTTTGLGDGIKTVSAAGTDEALAGSTTAKWVIVQAQTDNTGKIAVGVTGVDATVATGDGILLSAGESLTLPIDNLADVFIDATVTGDGVRYIYGT